MKKITIDEMLVLVKKLEQELEKFPNKNDSLSDISFGDANVAFCAIEILLLELQKQNNFTLK